MSPTISVCIPVYNREKEVSLAIRSALEQPLENLEVLVVDNFSTDGTWDVVRGFSDKRLCAVRNEKNLGLFGNFNRCRDLARGEFVRFLCSDDRLTAGCLERELDAMRRNPSAVILNTPLVVVDPDQRLLRTGRFLSPGLYRGEQVIEAALWFLASHAENLFNFPSGMLLRRAAIEKAGPFDLSLLGAADFDYWLRMLDHGDLLMIPEPGCEITEHSGQEGHPLFLAGSLMRANFEIAKRRESGNSKGKSGPLTNQMGGRCFWYLLKLLRMKQLNAAGLHWKMLAEYEVSHPRAFLEFLRFAMRKTKSKYFHLPVDFSGVLSSLLGEGIS